MAWKAFTGTTQKCLVCEKTVYLVDQFTVDNRVYHRACFRCHHCKGTLKLSNYSSFEGVLYCKPHYDQLFKKTGSLEKSFEGAPRSAKVDRSNNHEGHTNNRASSVFIGTQDKCVLCKRTVYPIEKVAVDGNSYHRPCFKCAHGGCVISPSNYVAHEGRLYCKHHHSQLFMSKGNFSQLEDKSEDVKVSTENHDEHEDVKVLTENQATDVQVSTENPATEAKASTENPVTDNGAQPVTDNGAQPVSDNGAQSG